MNDLRKLWADITDDKVSMFDYKKTAAKAAVLVEMLLDHLDELHKRIDALETAISQLKQGVNQ